MADIRPFRALLPKRELAARIAALPYDVYSSSEARREVKLHPDSFLCIDRPETQFPEGTDMYAPQVYEKARELLWKKIEGGYYTREAHACYYVYELTMDGRSQTGLVACAAVADYESGVIRRHENTRREKEDDRVRHIEACGAQTGPAFLAYRKNERIREKLFAAKEGEPIFDFTAADGVRHRGWRIDDEGDIADIREALQGLERLYIADGHHRAAAAVRIAQHRRAENAKHQDQPRESEYFLSVLFAEDELKILDYNRVVRDLNGHTAEGFLQLLSEKCELRENSIMDHDCSGGVCRLVRVNAPCRPDRRGTAGMYLAGTWYELTFREERRPAHAVDGLDVSFLQREILEPILGIRDPRTDSRISFVGGIRGLGELQRMADETGGVAFSMFPTDLKELFAVADEGLLMPPKSTWFEPKLRSGLFLHEV